MSRGGSLLGRLEHARVAAEQRREDLPGHVRKRRVERDQEPGDADRRADAEHRPVRHARGRRRPVERRPSPATKKPISIAASVSPRARSSGLPVSAATTSESSSRCSRKLSAISRRHPRARRRFAPPRRAAHAARPRRRRPRPRPPSERRHTAPRRRPVEPCRTTPRTPRRLLPVDVGSGSARDHQADQPPSTTRFEPVTYDDASEARNTTAPSASAASAIRPSGWRAAYASRNSPAGRPRHPTG